MSNLLSAFKASSGKLLKGMAIELAIEFYHDELIATFAEALSHINPAEVADFVHGKKALPISPKLFAELKGLEDYLQKIGPARIFEWLSEANPSIAQVLMELGDEGAEYIVNFKTFVIDSIKGSRIQDNKGEQEEEKAEVIQAKKKTLTCDECGESWVATEEEAATITKCPFCESPG